MKTILQKTLVAIACLLCSITIYAADFEVDDIYYNITSDTDKMVEVTGGYYTPDDLEFYTGSVVIPSTVSYLGIVYNVTSIGIFAFADCTGLTSITIPQSVTSIGYSAFEGCIGLKKITIADGDNTLSVDDNSYYRALFSDCPLETLYLGRNLSRSDAHSPFSNNDELRSVIIGSSVTYIFDCAFAGCSGLTEVTIPNSVTSIGEETFKNCTGLTSVTIPNSVTSIGQYAFEGCTGLIDITVNSSGSLEHVFNDCTGLKSVVIGNSITKIGGNTFSGCSGLTSITIGESVSDMSSQDIFEGCENLSQVYCKATTPPTLHIAAFERCSANRVLYVPVGYGDTYRKDYTWSYNFSNIQEFNFSDDNEGDNNNDDVVDVSEFSADGFSYNVISDGCVEIVEYTGANSTVIIPSSVNYMNKSYNVVEIGEFAFAFSYISAITIPETIYSIDNYAFYDCYYLLEITVQATTPPTIAKNTFNDYTPTLIVPYGCANVYRNALYWSNFSNIHDGTSGGNDDNNDDNNDDSDSDEFTVNGIDYIKTTASTVSVVSSTNMSNVAIPATVTYGGSTYKVTYIKEGAFKNNTYTTSVTIGENIEMIEPNAFEGCSSLKTVKWNAIDCKTYDDGESYYPAFYDRTYTCSQITKFVFGEKVERIPHYICSNMDNLTSVVIPEGVKLIGGFCFTGCSRLETITWNAIDCETYENGGYYYPPFICQLNSHWQITKFAFGEKVKIIPVFLCTDMINLREITIPKSVTEIGYGAFDNCVGVENVNVYPTTPPTIKEETFAPGTYNSAQLVVYSGTKSKYKSASYWKNFKTIVDSNSSVEFVDADNINIGIIGGTLSINGVADDVVVNIYTTSGMLLHHTTVAGSSNIALPSGIYLIQVDGITKKVVVK